MIIYVSHPFQNEAENVKSVEKIIIELVEQFPNDTFISPLHSFGFLWDYTTYEQGLDMCLDLLDSCDMMIVYGDYPNSKGCMRELIYCMDNYIPFTNEEGFLQLVGQNKSLKEVREALKFW